MDHLTFPELAAKLKQAAKQVPPGSVWQHYKGAEYIIQDLVVIEATNEVAVIYYAVDHPAIPFYRPLTVWLQTVISDHQPVPRFRRLLR